MEGVHGRRKALVYFSEGIDYDITDPFNNRDATTIIDCDARRHCLGHPANVAFYGIDVRGLGAGSTPPSRFSRFPTIHRSASTAQRC